MILTKKGLKDYIEKYNNGMTILEASKVYNKKPRTIREFEGKLRKEGLIKLRRELFCDNPIDLEFALGIKVDRNRIIKVEKLDKQDITDMKRKLQIQWSYIKPKKRLKTKVFKTYLAIGDTHIPEQNNIAIKSVLKLSDDICFDGFFIVGDFMDMAPISHWLQGKNKRKTLESKRLKKDYIIGNSILDEFDKRLPEKCDKRFWYGNHERFYYDFIEQYPQLEGLFDPKIELHLKNRGYIVYDNVNHVERVGRLSITHGMYTGVNFLKKHLAEFKTNVLHAHLHSPRLRTDNSPAKELATIGYSLGSLCDHNPSYMGNKPAKWSHGFAVIYFYKDGFFDVDLKRIVKGKFIYNGKEYNGNK